MTSKIPKQELAYSAEFQDGKMIEHDGDDTPKPCAGHKGTVI